MSRPVERQCTETQLGSGPLKSTIEIGYIDSSRICNNSLYSELGRELLCCICHNVLWKPVSCSTCEYAFCVGCIRAWINKQHPSREATCPFNCMFQAKRAPPILINLLSKLEINCAYVSNGCKAVASYDALEKHEEICPHEPTPCKICKTPVSYRDINNRHGLKLCFKEMYDRNPDHVQAQFVKVVGVMEVMQKRIQTLENMLGIDEQKRH